MRCRVSFDPAAGALECLHIARTLVQRGGVLRRLVDSQDDAVLHIFLLRMVIVSDVVCGGLLCMAFSFLCNRGRKLQIEYERNVLI